MVDFAACYETTRYRSIFERPSYLTRLRRTGWLGRADSNLCISESEFAKTLSPGGGAHLESSRTSYKPLKRPIDAYIPLWRDEVQQI